MTTITKLTGNELNRTNSKAENLFGCSGAFASEMHSELKFLSVFNAILATATIMGNTFILISLRKVSSIHPPTKLLIRNLAATDLLVGLISEPLAIVYWTSLITERWDICHYSFLLGLIIGYALCGVSLFTLTAMSIDRLIALSLGLRYRQIVTLKRTSVVVATFWVVCLCCSATFTYVRSYQAVIWASLISIILCLIISVLSYTRIFLGLRHQENQVHQIQGPTPEELPTQLNMARYKKAVTSVFWLQITLLICYLPHGILTAFSSRGLSQSISFFRQFTVTLIFLNSTLNPVLYCWKLKEIRQEVKELWLLKHICKWSHGRSLRGYLQDLQRYFRDPGFQRTRENARFLDGIRDLTATREAAWFTEILACVAVVSVSFKPSEARIQERETHKGIVLKGAKKVVAGRRGAGKERKRNGVFGSPPLPRLILIFAHFRLARLFSRLA